MPLDLFYLFNRLTPKDLGSRKLARNVPFGDMPRQQLDIYAPRWGRGPWPVVFFIYGGSWMDGSRHNYDFAGRALAAKGFVTVVADYRLVPSVEYPVFLEDCAAAFGWVVRNIAQHGGDPKRIGLMGHSAGAYNAAMLVLDPRYLQTTGMLGRVRCLVGLSGPYDFLPFDGPISLRTFGAVPHPHATQPINHVTPALPPTFLATGDGDPLVAPRNTAALAQRLREAGVEVEEKHYARLGHPHTLLALSLLGRPMAPVLHDATAFLHRHLGD